MKNRKNRRKAKASKPTVPSDVRNPLLPPEIFKLHAIACDELFDYLSLKDLHSLGQTCQRFQRLTGLYFQQNFRSVEIRTTKNGIKASTTRKSIDVNGFSKYVERILIGGNKLKELQFLDSDFRSIKTLVFNERTELTETDIDSIKHTLRKLECIEVPIIHDDIHEKLLKFCSNLKCLLLINAVSENRWLLQKYPMLERVVLPFYSQKVMELKIFLEQNPSIRYLEIHVNFLLQNKDLLMTTTATLDKLCIIIFDSDDSNAICKLLNELYARGFFKRLNINAFILSQNCVDLLAKLPVVEKIFFVNTVANIVWPTLKQLKQLELFGSYDFNAITKHVNIERISISFGVFGQILNWMSQAKNLKEITVTHMVSATDGKRNSILDIETLNDARKKLKGARNVIIYLSEDIYLPTKRIFGHREFNLIEIRRSQRQPSSIWIRGS